MTTATSNLTIQISQEIEPSNPRTEWDNLGTMVCFHRRYRLGDTHHGLRSEDFSGWEALEKHVRKQGAVVILPIYLYDHSGLTISTKPFDCPWDSGRIGLIYVTAEKLRAEHSKKRVTKKLIEAATLCLQAEVETYDQYLRGDVWYYAIKDEDGEVLDSCGDMYGRDYCEQEAKEAAEFLAKKRGVEVNEEIEE